MRILALGASLGAVACGPVLPDAADTPAPAAPSVAVVPPATRADGKIAVQQAPAVYREMTIPAGTILRLAMTSSVASNTNAVEDGVTAELMESVMVNGRIALPTGARLGGHVTEVVASGRGKGPALIAVRFTTARTGDEQYEIQAVPSSHSAPPGLPTTGGNVVRLGTRADVSTRLTAPLTVRVRVG